MNTVVHNNRPRATFEWLTIGIFALLLGLPTADLLLHLDHARPPMENRGLAPAAGFEGIGHVGTFASGFEAYFNDHFGFRKRLIRWDHHWKAELFQDPGEPQVLLGREGWLFFSGGDMAEHLTRVKKFSEADLENWERLLETRRDWCAARGMGYLFVVAPDKQTIYPEYLPNWLKMGAGPSKVEQLTAYLKERRSKVKILDLTASLRAAKRERPVYLKTDTHWNLFGAFVGSQEVMKALTNQSPKLTALPEDYYQWTLNPKAAPGDLAAMLGTEEMETAKETCAYRPISPSVAPTLEMVHDDARLPERKPNQQKPLLTVNPQGTGRALVFHDSFGARWWGFLGLRFHEVFFIGGYKWDRPLIEHVKPDAVIDEVVERNLNTQNPAELLDGDKLSEAPGRLQ